MGTRIIGKHCQIQLPQLQAWTAKFSCPKINSFKKIDEDDDQSMLYTILKKLIKYVLKKEAEPFLMKYFI